MSIKEAENAEATIVEFACKAPATWALAIAGYFADRRDVLISDLDKVSEFEASRRSHQIDALHALASEIGAVEQDINETKERRDARKKIADGLPASASKEERIYRLYWLLTPAGWRENQGSWLQNVINGEIDEILLRKDVVKHQARLLETRRLLRFLENVEKQGQAVATEQMRKSFERVVN